MNEDKNLKKLFKERNFLPQHNNQLLEDTGKHFKSRYTKAPK